MTKFEEGYTGVPSLPSRHPSEHIKHLEALLRRQEKALELAQVLIRVNEANPNKYSDFENECKQDAEALRYAIDVVKWVEDMFYKEKGHWVKREVRGQETLCCSKCGSDTGTIYEYDFCPHCGIEMDDDNNG